MEFEASNAKKKHPNSA
jgi:hypothetical protein